jgi:glycosyltransferase involved in cell wall biosynthesis
MERCGLPWEVVFADDGSRDGSFELLLALTRSDSRVTVLRLSRNWGHQAAITAGLAHAAGDAVVLMDGDLQDPPELIPELVAAWQAGAQVVVAERLGRSERSPRAYPTNCVRAGSVP